MKVPDEVLNGLMKEFESEVKDLVSEDNNDNFDQLERKVLKIRQKFGQHLMERILKFKSKKKNVKNVE